MVEEIATDRNMLPRAEERINQHAQESETQGQARTEIPHRGNARRIKQLRIRSRPEAIEIRPFLLLKGVKEDER